MENLAQIFNFEGNAIRTVVLEGTPYFLGTDVADVLGYKNNRDALSKHVDLEDKQTLMYKDCRDLRQAKQLLWNKPNDFSNKVVINESGLYALIFGSKLPQAKQFKYWVTSEVLPAIRKHGAYLTDKKANDVVNGNGLADLLIQAGEQLKQKEAELAVKQAELKEAHPKVEYYERVMNSDVLLTMTTIAKNYGMTAMAMNKLLHKLGVQFKQGGSWTLYSQYADKGYVHTQMYVPSAKSAPMVSQTKWTPKGQKFVYDLLSEYGIKPMIEMQEVTV